MARLQPINCNWFQPPPIVARDYPSTARCNQPTLYSRHSIAIVVRQGTLWIQIKICILCGFVSLQVTCKNPWWLWSRVSESSTIQFLLVTKISQPLLTVRYPFTFHTKCPCSEEVSKHNSRLIPKTLLWPSKSSIWLQIFSTGELLLGFRMSVPEMHYLWVYMSLHHF